MKDSCDSYIIRVSCPATSGIISAVTSFLSEHDCYISELAQYDDEELQNFFLRAKFRFNEGVSGDIETLRDEFAAIAKDFEMEWQIYSSSKPMRVLLMVSKFDHCLADLLYRWRIGELPIEPVAIISNHPRAAIEHTHLGGIPFHHLPVTSGEKSAQEEKVRAIAEESGAELVVLARYMQILSDEQAAHFSGRCINIHHSFLPSFKGARPYARAHERGVKLIGATAHFVTSDLDEGPIIEQDVERVDHRATEQDLVVMGRDIEARVLARAVRWTAEQKVFLNGARTVVFR